MLLEQVVRPLFDRVLGRLIEDRMTCGFEHVDLTYRPIRQHLETQAHRALQASLSGAQRIHRGRTMHEVREKL